MVYKWKNPQDRFNRQSRKNSQNRTNRELHKDAIDMTDLDQKTSALQPLRLLCLKYRHSPAGCPGGRIDLHQGVGSTAHQSPWAVHCSSEPLWKASSDISDPGPVEPDLHGHFTTP